MRRALSLLLVMAIGAAVSLAQTIQLVNAFPSLTFTQPVFLTHSNDGTNRIFVVQQNGLIRVFANDSLASAASTFLNVSSKLSSPGGEEGLLGLAFHPNYTSNGYFYVNYTAPNPLRTVVARYSVSTSNPDKADSLSEYKILEITQPYSNHNGGMIAFGLDGYLYIGMGDGGAGNDPQNHAQDRTDLLGDMLRIDVNDTTVTRRYVIPTDNPFYGNMLGYREEIWAWGLRNPFRFSIDPVSGELWVGDVGQVDREEVDLIERGKNYGWRIMEGNICNPAYGPCDTTSLTRAVKDYGRNLGNTVIGGHIYRGYRQPNLRGAYIYTDFGSGRIWMLRHQNGVVTADSELINSSHNISGFGVDQDNEMYMCSYSSSAILRFTGNSGPNTVGEGIPEEFRLEQNYPNPYNPTTTIQFSIPRRSRVELKVFTALGEEVVTLVNAELGEGTYPVRWNSGNLASGMYLYRLRAGDYATTRKLLLLR
jgi:glucose/arabinose dehydrogenase